MITELERRLMDAFHEDAQRARLVHPDTSSVRDEVPVEEIYVSLDSPTSETRNRRPLAMAAAAVVAVIGVAAIAINSMNSNDDVEPAPAATTTVAPTTIAPRRETDAFESLTYIVPDGWENTGYEVTKGDPAIGITVNFATQPLYTSYCVAPGAYVLPGGRPMAKPEAVGPLVGPTVDDLVSAWANLPGVDATAARDVTIDGFDGKQIEFTVPDYDAGDCNGMFGFCAAGEEKLWCESALRDKDFPSDAPHQPLPDQHLKIWILDVRGFRHMVMAWSFPDTSPQDRAALDEIVASIQFGTFAAETTVAPTTVAPTTVAPTTETVSFDVDTANGISVTFTKPDTWSVVPGFMAYHDSAGVLFDDISNIYADGCQGVLLDPPVGPTVDDLVAAWANLPDFAATAAVDVTVDGYAGKQIEFTVPDYTMGECNEFKFALWDVPGISIEDAPGYSAQGDNQHIQMSILDVDGTRLVIAAYTTPSASEQDPADIDEILASIQIG